MRMWVSFWGRGSTAAFSIPHPRHAESADAQPATSRPGPHHGQGTVPLSSFCPCSLFLTQSSSTRNLLPIGSPPHIRGGRSPRLSSWRFSKSPPYVVSWRIVYGFQRTLLILAYLSPSTLDHLLYPEEALNCFPGIEPIIVKYSITDVVWMQNPSNQQMAEFLALFGVVGLLVHFRQRLRFWYKQAWWRVLQVKFLCSRCNFFLGVEQSLFGTLVIRDLQNFSSNNFGLRAQLIMRITWCHGRYLRGWLTFPLQFLKMGFLRKVDARFQELKALEDPPPARFCSPRPQWISSESICLINYHTALW